MASLRGLAWMCRDLAKQHVDDPDVPAAPDGADGYAEWVQIALILYRVELAKSLRETEDYLPCCGERCSNHSPSLTDFREIDGELDAVRRYEIQTTADTAM